MNSTPLFSDRKAFYCISLPLLALTLWCAVSVHRLSRQRTLLKEDFARVNSIKYGLLSVDMWRDRIQEIVSGSIWEFSLTHSQERDLKKVISNVLLKLISETEDYLQKRHRTLGEKIKKMVVTTFIDTDDLRKKIPSLTETIITEIKKPANKNKIKHLADTQLNAFAEQSYDNESDVSSLNTTLGKYHTTSSEEFNERMRDVIPYVEWKARWSAIGMYVGLGLFLLMGVRLWRERTLRPVIFSAGIGFAMIFLWTALATPMMEIDARINKVDVVLIGKHLVFEDQVLFYRSKSILQVVRTMLDTKEGGTVAVGILILLFSVVFPVAKLLSCEWILWGSEKARTNKWLQFFAFKSGKWSMADVMVVALFMTFIGFSSILESQLKNLNVKTDTLEAISTAGTSLQPGAYLFVVFVLLGLSLSFVLEKMIAGQADIKIERRKSSAS